MVRPIRVLVVDDDVEQLRLISRVLVRQGFEVETIDSPFGTTNLARRIRPDIILLDVDMPAIPGDQLVSVLRARLPGTKIVLFSATDVDDLRFKSMEVAADGYLAKTFDGDQLREQISRFVGR